LSLAPNTGNTEENFQNQVLGLLMQDTDPDPWTGSLRHILLATDSVHALSVYMTCHAANAPAEAAHKA